MTIVLVKLLTLAYVVCCLWIDLQPVQSFPLITDMVIQPFAKIIKPVSKNPECIYFSGAGIYFWWQLGVAKYMKDNCDLKCIQEQQVIGASAGSITSTLLLTGANLDILPQLAIDVSNEAGLYSRNTGLAGVWGSLLRKLLDNAIPNNINFETLSNLYIALTPTFSKPKLVSNFESKEDLIDAILASCHVPVFLDGRPYTQYRGENVIDGSFWYFVTKDRITDLPLPQEVRTDDIFWVDYVDDEDFMATVSGNFLELANPDGIYDMVDSGYNFMKREHYFGRLPFAKSSKPNFVTLSQRLAIPENLMQAIRKVDYFDFYKV